MQSNEIKAINFIFNFKEKNFFQTIFLFIYGKWFTESRDMTNTFHMFRIQNKLITLL